MKKNIILSSIATVALVSLFGCGSGSTSSSFTGYYLDSAIGGVDYACGSLSGVTDTDGKFSYELNKECTFSVGNIVLRKVSKDDLGTNTVTIIENNMTVARLLQTMDNDGDASNGISISKKMRDALTQNARSDTSDINSLYNNIIANIEGYQGHLVTETEAGEHLQATLKTILAGKTFYAVIEPGGTFLGIPVVTNDTGYVIPFSFNDDLTMVNEETEDATSIKFDGNRLTYPDDGSANYQLIKGKTDKYIKVQTIFVAGSGTIGNMRLYFNQKDAQAYADTIKNGGEDTNNSNNTTTSKTFTPPSWIQGTWMDRTTEPNLPTGWRFTEKDVYSIVGNYSVSGMKSVKSGDIIKQESSSTTYKYTIVHTSLNSTEGPFTFKKVENNQIQFIDSSGSAFPSCTKE